MCAAQVRFGMRGHGAYRSPQKSGLGPRNGCEALVGPVPAPGPVTRGRVRATDRELVGAGRSGRKLRRPPRDGPGRAAFPLGFSGPAKGKREDVCFGAQASHSVTRGWWLRRKGHHPLIQHWTRHLISVTHPHPPLPQFSG